AAASAGVGFGEFLAGYPELADRYTRASWPTRALVDVVADWDASGIGTTLPRSAAFSLWQDYTASLLPREELRRFSRLDSEQLAELWDEAVRFASQTVAGGESLITADVDGLCSSEFARSLTGRTAISAQAW